MKLRAVKSEEEAGYIAKAQSIADEAFSRLLPMVKAGVSEAELALELEFTMRKLGSDGIAFPFMWSQARGRPCPTAYLLPSDLSRGIL